MSEKRIFVIPTERINESDPMWQAWLAEYGDKKVKSLAVTRDAMLDAEHQDDEYHLRRSEHIARYGQECYEVGKAAMKAARAIEKSKRN